MAIKYIIAEGHDVGFFETKEEAESYYEAIDVEAGIYVGYDASGRLLRIEPKGQSARITLAEDTPGHVEELRALLLDQCEIRRIHVDGTELPALLRAIEDHSARLRAESAAASERFWNRVLPWRWFRK
jgi:hypothetical protein